MRYSNGFFLFEADKSFQSSDEVSNHSSEKWIKYGEINSFHCYNYLWIEKKKSGAIISFHDTKVWINTSKSIIVIYLLTNALLPEVTFAIKHKFSVRLRPFPIACSTDDFIQKTNAILGRIVNDQLFTIESNGLISTPIVKNDNDRIKLIHELTRECWS